VAVQLDYESFKGPSFEISHVLFTLMILCCSRFAVGSRARVQCFRLFTSIGPKSTAHDIKLSCDLCGEILSRRRGGAIGPGEPVGQFLNAFQARTEGSGRHRKDASTGPRKIAARHVTEPIIGLSDESVCFPTRDVVIRASNGHTLMKHARRLSGAHASSSGSSSGLASTRMRNLTWSWRG
jgi:hypothetical protein